MHEGFIYTNDRCVGCNRCVRVCSSFGASVANSGPLRTSIRINSDRCIVCGACIDVCAHGAREYEDDTSQLFADLEAGEAITLLVAPSFEAKYPLAFRGALGTLRQLGARRILPVSLGADICTWAYLKHIEEHGFEGMVSTSCPVVVSYVEHWMPEMIDRLMPVKSPLMCLATYCREQLNITDKLAFVGPCIGKSLEVKRYPDLVQYNVTFPRLIEHLRDYPQSAESGYDDLDYGLGSYYPAPGGLADNVRWFLGDDTSIRIVSGKQYLYERFEKHERKMISADLGYALIDALNCQEGCIEGTAREDEDLEDGGLVHIHRMRALSKSQLERSPWNPELSCAERLERLNRQFASLEVSSYRATFQDQSDSCHLVLPSEDEEREIFHSLHKDDWDARHVDCSACGYESCHEMVIAIHNGFNSRYNCVYFEKEESVYLARMSYEDQLTGVMNRNAFERMSGDLYGRDHSLSLIVADVNGLKHENDTNGHAAGDWLITTTAKAMASKFGRERVFRTGGDEFLVILQDFEEDEVAAGIEEVQSHLRMLGVSVSMGVAHCEHYEDGFEELHRRADVAMYAEKACYYETSSIPRRS